MKLRVGSSTDVGLVREHNEDSFLAGDGIFAVADGLGGHRGGEVASRVALETLQGEVATAGGSGDDGIPERLVQGVHRANHRVFEQAAADPNLRGMGTTLTAFVAGRGRLFLAHVGDSRGYLLRDGEMRALTEDHTLVHRMVMEGQLTQDEADIHPQRSVLTRALGIEDDVDVDQTTVEVTAGDRILLCSDGLTGMVDDDGIARILAEAGDPQEASDRLVRAAVQAGGVDNVTTVVVDVLDAEDPPPTVAADARAPERARDGATREPAPARRRWPRRALKIVLALTVLAGLILGAKAYVDRQWFVGVDRGNVALFQGIPARPLGLDLSTLVERTAVPAGLVTQLEPWRELAEGITAGSEEEAREVLEQIEIDVYAGPPKQAAPVPKASPTP